MTRHAKASPPGSSSGSGFRRFPFGPLCLGALALAAFLGSSAPASAAEPECPNEAIRIQQGTTGLPDCRAYEVVSKANGRDTSTVVGSFGFPEGEHVYYADFLPTPGTEPRNGLTERFLATRTASGWVQTPISPPQGEGPSYLALGAQGLAESVSFSADFSEAFVNSPYRDPFEEPQLNQTTGMGVYKLSLPSGAVSMQSLPDSGVLTQAMIEGSGAYRGFAEVNGWGSYLAGGSADGSRAFFITSAKLATAPGTPADTHEASNEIFERSGGHTYLVGVLPDGEVPVCGAEVGQQVGSTTETEKLYSYGAIAPSGANVVFHTPGPAAGLAGVPCNESETGFFLRDVIDGTTVRLPNGSFAGRAGTAPGEEEVIFTVGDGLHEYHVGTGQSIEVGAGDLLAYSPDGSWVYFLGPEEGIHVYHEASTKQIPGTQAGGYTAGGIGGGLIGGSATGYGQTRNMPVATPDGSHLLFIDSAKLTGYENEGRFEAYVYDAQTETVTCISCSPSGAPPQGRAQLIDEFSLDVTGNLQFHTPSPPFISNDGSRAVFETTDALLPQDVNGTTDVYEWAREGANGCTASSPTYTPVDEGCLYLLSSGLGKEVFNENGITNGTHLVGASEDLKDVYMQTIDTLVPGTDHAYHLYDVRAVGGFAEPVPSIGCGSPEGCGRIALPGVPPPTVGSGIFRGSPNPREGNCRRGFVRRHGRCVKPHRHRHRSHHRARAGRRARL